MICQGKADYRLTFTFRVKAQSRAMNNTSMLNSFRDVEFDAKKKRYAEYVNKCVINEPKIWTEFYKRRQKNMWAGFRYR